MKTALLTLILTCGALGQGSMAFTVSMEHPASQYYHVLLECDGLPGETQDFVMPAWAPGYYRLLDFEKNVSHFSARDGGGHALPWEKVTKNSWRVVAGNAPTITVEYDVFANVTFGVQNYLDDKRGYISPPGLFMYVAGRLHHPVTVTFAKPDNWAHIATGLDRVPNRPNTFSAPDFDLLFDCPTLMGNQESLQFDVDGVPHYVAIEDVPASVDRAKLLADLKRLVQAATRLMGDMPYKHYTFIMMGKGVGGIEHLTSASLSFGGNSLTNENGYLGFLSFAAHEYFHTFNVKRIRPIALGPFDYETENLTNMLWVSEGLSVYYQDLLLVRAGLMTREQYLAKLQNTLSSFENGGGHRYQSATDSSIGTWTQVQGLNRGTNISYYDNGAMLGAMLDLKIRHESGNRKSLDDVMRTLYRTYFPGKKRGFTDAEFRQECEAAAGAPLTEVFAYASTTRDPDYARYFALGGLSTSVAQQDAPGSYLGLNTQTVNGKLMVTGASADSPALAAGLHEGDEILEIEGVTAGSKALADLLAAHRPGDKVKLRISRGAEPVELEATLAKNTKSAYTVRPASDAKPLEANILQDWLSQH